jgi:hypothetical protein
MQVSDDEGVERSLRRQAELGRLLAAAAGYRVVASDGRQVGTLDHIRYRRHADHPDEIIVRRHALFTRRRRALPFSAVETVRARERTVVLRLDSSALERSPSARA